MNERYSRQELFRPIGEAGQLSIQRSHVLILGAGALGSANAEMLARAGIGRLTIVDRDYVEESNLQRQQLYSEEDVREKLPKAIAAKNRLEQVNSDVSIEAVVTDGNAENLDIFCKKADMILDATDNFDIRFILNDLAHKHKKPFVFGACVASTGMSYTILPGETPCLQCLVSSTPIVGATCDTGGIISPAVQMVAAHQTTEILKWLVGDRNSLRQKLILFDLWSNMNQAIKVEKAKMKNCRTCGNHPDYPFLSYGASLKTESLCGRNTVQLRTSTKTTDLPLLARKLEEIGPVHQNPFLVSVDYKDFRFVFFADGRTLVHGTNQVEMAKSVYHQLIG